MLVSCPYCGNQVSSKAYECPNCGYDLKYEAIKQNPTTHNIDQDYTFDTEQERYVAGFVLGIIALGFIIIPFIGFILGVIGLVLAIIKRDALYGLPAIVFNSAAILFSTYLFIFTLTTDGLNDILTFLF